MYNTRWLYCVECPQYSSQLEGLLRPSSHIPLPCYFFTVSNSGLLVFTSGNSSVLVYSILDIGRRRNYGSPIRVLSVQARGMTLN